MYAADVPRCATLLAHLAGTIKDSEHGREGFLASATMHINAERRTRYTMVQ